MIAVYQPLEARCACHHNVYCVTRVYALFSVHGKGEARKAWGVWLTEQNTALLYNT